MANLVRWEPFEDVMSLRDAMSRLFDESLVRSGPFGLWPFGSREDGSALAVDMYETDGDVMVKAPCRPETGGGRHHHHRRHPAHLWREKGRDRGKAR